MRTTLTIHDDVAKALKDRSRQSGDSFEVVTNEVLRQGLTTEAKPAPASERFRVRSAARGFRSGIDPLELNQLVDELGTERFVTSDHTSPHRS